jgi:glycine hydroxymethyltransferase
MTTRGLGLVEAEQVADLVADVLEKPEDERNLSDVRACVHTLTRRYPVYG